MNAGRLAVLAFLTLWLAPAVGADWAVQPDASRLAFQSTFEGTTFEVAFRRFQAHIRFDPAHPEAGRFEVVVDLSAADAGSADLNQGMAGPEWFHTSRFPTATYTTRAIRALGPARYEADGLLTVKGVSRPVALDFGWREEGGTAHLSGEAQLRRTDFGVGEGEWADDDTIGRTVRVVVDLRLEPGAGQ